MHPVFHVSVLWPHYASGNYQPPPLPACVDGELEYEVGYVERAISEGKKRQYLTHWEGDQDPATWEPLHNLTLCREDSRILGTEKTPLSSCVAMTFPLWPQTGLTGLYGPVTSLLLPFSLSRALVWTSLFRLSLCGHSRSFLLPRLKNLTPGELCRISGF
jgi:hypothetical protein